MAPQEIFSLTGKNVLIVTHRSADLDAIASAEILRLELMERNIVEIAIPGHVNRQAKRIAEVLEIPYSLSTNFSKFDVLAVVDLNSYSMLDNFAEEIKNFKGKKFLFDHHTASGENIVDKENSLVIEDAASTTEVIWHLFSDANKKISEKQALLTMLGIISDTDRFAFSSRNTFDIMSDALKISRMDFNQVIKIIKDEKTFSERVATLKAMQKTKLVKIKDVLIAKSYTNAFEAQVAEALVACGADIAIVGGITEGKARVSGRADITSAEKYNLDLASDVFQRLSSYFKGQGGGHSTAASFNGEAKDLEKIIEKCVEIISEKVRNEKKIC
ncbi:MAG: DHH family phosphoesterase [Candidatus Diapherotrites archaeon]